MLISDVYIYIFLHAYIPRQQKWRFGNCISVQIWLFWVSILVFGFSVPHTRCLMKIWQPLFLLGGLAFHFFNPDCWLNQSWCWDLTPKDGQLQRGKGTGNFRLPHGFVGSSPLKRRVPRGCLRKASLIYSFVWKGTVLTFIYTVIRVIQCLGKTRSISVWFISTKFQHPGMRLSERRSSNGQESFHGVICLTTPHSIHHNTTLLYQPKAIQC